MIAPSNRRTDGTFFAWDSTMLKAVEKCHRYAKYKLLDGWQSPMKSVHLRFGGHYATALEHFYKKLVSGLSREEALEEVIHETLINTWDIVGSRDGEPIGAPWNSYDTNKTRETLIRTIIWYLDFFEEDTMETVILPSGAPAVEYSFSLEVDDGVSFCGHLDRLVTQGDNYYITDQKTTGTSLSPYYFRGFKPDTQMSLYTFAGKALFNLPVSGIVIDAAQIAVGFSRFERGFSFRSDEELDEWYEGAMHTIMQFNSSILTDKFPMNPSACGNYGGCEFREICSLTPRVREGFLESNFSRGKIWNPLERR